MNQLWGPAMEAELEYRRERAAQAYATPAWWIRARARSAARSAARSDARSGARSGARSAARWGYRVARPGAPAGEGLEALTLPAGTGSKA